jgi:hypothetical protein
MPWKTSLSESLGDASMVEAHGRAVMTIAGQKRDLSKQKKAPCLAGAHIEKN